jgi:hypothetical protein
MARKPWNKGKRKISSDDVLNAHNEGLQAADIAEMFHVCLATAYNALRAAGIHSEHVGSKGAKNPQWNGGTYREPSNLRLVKKFFQNAREVATLALGRLLSKDEVVHHHDENPTNNDVANLWVFPTTGDHSRYHCALRNHRRQGLLAAATPVESAFCGRALL